MSSKGKEIDAIVLAGSGGTAMIEQDGKPTPKPFLRLGGEPLVLKVCRALVEAAGVGKIFLVGDTGRLAESLEALPSTSRQRVEIVPEGGGVLENSARAYFQHVLPARGLNPPPFSNGGCSELSCWLEQHQQARSCAALFVTADLPFVTSADVEDFLRLASTRAALIMGLVDYRGLERLWRETGRDFSLERWKLGAVHLRGVSVRMSNLFLVRPLMGNPRQYTLLEDLYRHRRLLDPHGGINLKSWLATGKSILRHAWRVNSWWRFVRGMMNFLPALGAGMAARLAYRASPRLAWPWRMLLGKADVEFIGSLLLGAPGEIVIVDHPAPAIDIDVQESFRFLEQNGEAGYRRLAAVLQAMRQEKTQAPPPHAGT